MRYAIISDIHGNLEALQSVLAEIKKKDVDSILCLGDMVGYGPNPNECIDLIKEQAEVILAGNHDYAPLGKIELSYFNQWARIAIEWTSENLNPASIDFLKSLPLQKEVDGFTIVHATPLEPDEWNYIISLGDAAKNFPEFKGQICFIGHSHVPMVVSVDEERNYCVLTDNPLKIHQKIRYIINVGSVGQPRDSNPMASFAILDTADNVYELLRVPYDIAKTQKKIRENKLPEMLAARLEVGQ